MSAHLSVRQVHWEEKPTDKNMNKLSDLHQVSYQGLLILLWCVMERALSLKNPLAFDRVQHYDFAYRKV